MINMTVKPIEEQLWRLGRLSCVEHLSSLQCLSTLGHLSNPTLFQNNNLKRFKLKNKVDSLMPYKSLTCLKPNLFRCTYDFPIWWITTFDLHCRASYYLKELLWLNVKRNKIVNIKTKLNVLTISLFGRFVTKYYYINPLKLS